MLEPAGAAKKKRAPEDARVFHSEFVGSAMPGGNREAHGGRAMLEPAVAAKKKRAPEDARVFHSEFGGSAMPGGNREAHNCIKGLMHVALSALKGRVQTGSDR